MLSASVDGELSEREEQELQEHLKTCRGCRETLALLRVTAEALRQERTEPPEKLAEGILFLAEKERSRRRFSLKGWRFTAIAAVICLGVLGVVHFSGAGSSMAPARSAPMKAAADELETGAAVYRSVAWPAAAEGSEDRQEMAGYVVGDSDLRASGGSAAMADSTNTVQPAATPAPPQAQEEPAPAETIQPAGDNAYDGGTEGNFTNGGADSAETETEPTEESSNVPGSTIYYANTLAGYQIYRELEDADRYYSVCFVYGSVPETISGNRECTRLDAPEGQERWLVPLSVCLNEELKQQFNEVYFGDLLSQQGLVIAIQKEEEEWAP